MSALEKSTNFPAELAREMFNKVTGHSALAKLCGSTPIPFTGTDVFVFDFDHEVSIVGEGLPKPAGDANIEPVKIRPIKVVYQSRVNDEFVRAARETQLRYLNDFAEGFAKKLARGLDIMAFHGVNPYDGQASQIIGTNHFDSKVPAANVVTYTAGTDAIDEKIDETIAKVEAGEYPITGMVMAPEARTAIGAMKVGTGNATRLYPDFAFGGAPATLGGATLDVNGTLAAASSDDLVLVGDFETAFKWGYAANMPLEVIEYGNPDGGTYDLKQANQVLLRSEAYIGWGILNPAGFALLEK